MLSNAVKVGSPQLSARVLAGDLLRHLREATGMSREMAGRLVDVNRSTIWRIERGHVQQDATKIARLLTLYGVTDERQRETVIGLATGRLTPGWWDGRGLPLWARTYIRLEASAQALHEYAPALVPDLLQTPEYARAAIALERLDRVGGHRPADAFSAMPGGRAGPPAGPPTGTGASMSTPPAGTGAEANTRPPEARPAGAGNPAGGHTAAQLDAQADAQADTRLEAQVEAQVQTRLLRQRALHGPGAARLWAIVDEAALRRVVGDTGVHARQLDALIHATERPNVTLQVIPLDRTSYLPRCGSFTVLRFARVHDVVYADQPAERRPVREQRDADTYRAAHASLAAAAAPPGDTARILAGIRAALHDSH